MLTAASQSFDQLLGLRALLGFGQAVTEPSATSLISDYDPTQPRCGADRSPTAMLGGSVALVS